MVDSTHRRRIDQRQLVIAALNLDHDRGCNSSANLDDFLLADLPKSNDQELRRSHKRLIRKIALVLEVMERSF